MRGRVFFLCAGLVAACSSSKFSATDSEGKAGAGGTSTTAGSGGSLTPAGAGGTETAGTDGSTAGGSAVGGGRGVVGGAGGMGAYGGKPPLSMAGGAGRPELPVGTGGNGAEGGMGASGGTSADGGTTSTGGSAGDAGGTMEPGTGGASMESGGTGGDSGSGGMSGAGGAGAGSSGGTTGGSAGATGGTGGAGGAGGAGSGGGGGTGGGGGSAMTGGTGGTLPVGGCNNELLVNADFEQGKAVGWTSTSDWPGIDLIVPKTEPALVAEGVSPYAGSYLAWLGGIPDNQWDHNVTMISQYVQIPATASALTLSGRHLVQSIDDPSDIFDVSYLEFDLNDKVVWQSLALTNQTVTDGWVAFEKTTNDVSGLAGKTLLFYAYARTDPTGKTSFFLDSLSLIASCGR